VGEIERDQRRRLVDQLAEGDDGGAQIALAGRRQAAVACEAVDDVLQRRRLHDGMGDGVKLHGRWLCVGPSRPRGDRGGQAMNFGNTSLEQMGRLLDVSIPELK
jgi:hypothetical protein